MIPNNDNLQDFEQETEPNKTYYLNIENNTITGFCDGIEAIKQAIYKILNTERFDYLIYSWNYGIEFKNLIGEPKTYVIPELERVITEALLQDDRIEEVTNFEFISEKNIVNVKFKVITKLGNIEIEKAVTI